MTCSPVDTFKIHLDKFLQTLTWLTHLVGPPPLQQPKDRLEKGELAQNTFGILQSHEQAIDQGYIILEEADYFESRISQSCRLNTGMKLVSGHSWVKIA